MTTTVTIGPARPRLRGWNRRNLTPPQGAHYRLAACSARFCTTIVVGEDGVITAILGSLTGCGNVDLF
jgi:hypothetical protein